MSELKPKIVIPTTKFLGQGILTALADRSTGVTGVPAPPCIILYHYQ